MGKIKSKREMDKIIDEVANSFGRGLGPAEIVIPAIKRAASEPVADRVEKAEVVKVAMLPLISVLPKPEMKEAQLLLEELDALTMQAEVVAERQGEVKSRLRELQGDRQGLRHGQLAFYARLMQGKRTLSAERLVEAGVPANLVEEGYGRGKEYWQMNFARVK